MDRVEILREAFHSLGQNRLRSALAMLGVIIGVAAVDLMLAVGETTRREVDRSIAAMGSNILIILSGSTTTGGLRVAAGSAPTLTEADVAALARLPNVVGAAGAYPTTAQVIASGTNWSTVINGVTGDYFMLRDWQTTCGTLFNATDLRTANRFAVLGATVSGALFGPGTACGKIIHIAGNPYMVMGVLDRKGQTLDGRDQDDAIFIPLNTFQAKVFGSRFPGTVRYLGLKARSLEDMPAIEEEAALLLRQRHRLRNDAQDDFTIRNLMSVARTATTTARAMSAMLGAIAAIALVVGGIGIMNIMLATVSERTREIGLRMAVGGTQRAILSQFLTESVVICLLGGLVGTVLAFLGSWIAAISLGITIEITISSLVLAVSFSLGVGIAFGWWPAWKASRMNPVDALRME